jgi:signal transduction histidine kinase
MSLVRDAAAVLEEKGASAYPELRKEGSRWLRDDTYLFVFTSDGTRAFHAAEPESEGRNDSKLLDVLGRPIVRMILDAAAGPSGDGWVHYMYPQPGGLFPAWKSAFVKRVTFPSGEQHIVGAGIYNMRMDREFIEDVVSRAAALLEERGEGSFPLLRDRTGPFVFMDTYVFVQGADGTELVNPAQPSLEGRNLMELKDLQGKPVVRDQMAALENADSAWVDCYWYRPGDNVPALKQTFVRKVRCGEETYIVGSGIYAE